MTPMARTHPWSVSVNEMTRCCLMADPAWNGSEFTRRPDRGWRAWVAALQVLMNRTPAALRETFGTRQEVIDAVRSRAERWATLGFDAHDWLYQSWAYDAHDLGNTPGFEGDTGAALASITASTLVLAPPLDLYNPVEAAREAAERIPGCQFREIPSRQGHQAASALSGDDAAFINRAVQDFLAG